MRYLFAILLPPLAVLLCSNRNPISGLIATALNLVLCLCFYIPGAIHALFVVAKYHADCRNDKLISALTRAKP